MVASRVFGKLSAEAVVKEASRLTALEELDMLDTPRDPGFDRVVKLIQEIFTVEIGIISFIDAHRQWYKGCSGMPAEEVAREDTFCRYVLDSDQELVVQDTAKDARFAQHPAVVGPPHVRFYAGFPLRTKDGHVVGTVCALDSRPRSFGKRDAAVLQEFADLVMDRVALLNLASTDGLTGVKTRRSFCEEGHRFLSQAARYRHEISCIMLDIDHFKTINDRHGHATGDLVLKAVASACKAQLRASDLFGRLGGEEFAIMLPHVDREGALATAEKLRQIIASLFIGAETGPISVTASFGVTAVSIIGKDLDTLLSQADTAMYQAKQSGRNRCEAWGRNSQTEGGERRRVLKSGRIIINDRRSTIDCTIRSLGVDGAGIVVSNASLIPQKFQLSIDADGFEATCRIISQRRNQIEVSFLQ